MKKLLGVAKYRFGRAEEEDRVGVCTGLAYTETGGELLQTEVSVTPGKGKLQVTGRLGEVMQESANAAMSLRALAGEAAGALARLLLEGRHPHPRARGRHAQGRALRRHHDRHRDRVGAYQGPDQVASVAMTGEITLRGRVLPIGGLKEKLIAAMRGGVEVALVPKENEKDLRDLPSVIKKALDIVLVEHMDEVLSRALALGDPETFLQDGFHEIDDIYEVPPGAGLPAAATDLPHPAGVN